MPPQLWGVQEGSVLGRLDGEDRERTGRGKLREQGWTSGAELH